MRTNNKIIKITGIEFPIVSFVSRNGEFRRINIESYFKNIDLEEGDFGYEILKSKKRLILLF